jgi:hypothetical protein
MRILPFPLRKAASIANVEDRCRPSMGQPILPHASQNKKLECRIVVADLA